MRTSERLLLYLMAFSLGGAFVLGDGSKSAQAVKQGRLPQGAPVPVAPRFQEKTTPRSNRERVSEKITPPPGLAAASREPLRSLELVDAAGRSRIRLKVEDDGQARFEILDSAGQPVVSISAAEGGNAEISVRNKKAHAGLRVQPSGELTLTLEKNGGASAHMGISETGDALVGVVSKKGGIEAVLRSDVSGAAEVAVHKVGTDGGPSMSMHPGGQMGVSVKGADGITGPVMQVFEDGLAEIAIPGSDGESGPSMLLMPEGVSVISLRRPGGKLGASMIIAPDGSAIVATSAGEGKGEATIRVDSKGKPVIEIVDPETGRRKQLQPKSD